MNTGTLRSQDEIVTHVERRLKEPFDFQAEALIGFLDFDKVKHLLKPEVTAEQWAEDQDPYTREGVIDKMRDYFEFAVGKATGHRGISASRSVDKMRAWVWLLGEDGEIDWDDYPQYGCPILKQVADRYEFEVPELDREAFERMAVGERCRDDCMEGCGT